MNKNILISFIILAILTVFFIFYINKNEEVKIEDVIVNNKEEVTNTAESLKDVNEYINTTRKFSLEYPKDLSVEEIKEGGVRRTIIFSDKTGEKSFQIYFTPYDDAQITLSRILSDVPSGKFTQPTEVLINGDIKALVFFSTTNLGEMREIWFIHKGYLYEVTTYKELDLWMSDILKTWEFN